MRSRTSVFVDIEDSARMRALTDLLSQSNEFEILGGLNDEQDPSVFLLYVNLNEKRPSLERCRSHRTKFQHSSLIVLAGSLTNAGDVEEFEAISDDVLCEPFRFGDLISSIRLQVRNRQWLASESVRIGGLTFLPVERLVRNEDGAKVILSTLESRLLHHLFRASGKTVSRNMLLKEVWGYEPTVDTTTVQTHVHRIRHKLRELDQDGEFIITKGDGYGLAANGPAD